MKTGFSIPQQSIAELDALAFALAIPKSRIVAEGIRLRAESLTPDERRKFEAARAVRGTA